MRPNGEPLEFWTHDERQATAALSRGLNVRGTNTTSGIRDTNDEGT